MGGGHRVPGTLILSVLTLASNGQAFSSPSPAAAFTPRQGGGSAHRCTGCSAGRLAAQVGGQRRGTGEAVSPRILESTVKDHGGSREFCIGVLGDLHLDEGDMDLHHKGRDHMVARMAGAANPHLVSLGDLGANGEAGTSRSFAFSHEYLSSFQAPFDIVTGNHDLEGMKEFETDEANLDAFLEAFGKQAPQFCTEIAHKTLCVGLSTVRFRSARWSSHEVFVDDAQVDWFDAVLQSHPASDGWNVIVFTHAPIMGCGLRALQDVHIRNACAWINHSEEESRGRFIDMCHRHPCVRAWFSGHFHLSQDYKEAITTGGSGQAFCQVGVIGEKSTRDGRRQSRLVRGDAEGLRIFTVNHHLGGSERLDMEILYNKDPLQTPEFKVFGDDGWIEAPKDMLFNPLCIKWADDGCYLESFYGENPDAQLVPVSDHSPDGKVCWWHMADGKVLVLHDGMLVEYDSKTLAPLGIVLDRAELKGKEIVVADEGRLAMTYWDNDDAIDGVETCVIHPNDDGSYYRRFQRNKLRRTQEKQREDLAKKFVSKLKSRKNK